VKIATVWVGKGRVGWADEASHEYSRRLPRHLDYTEIQVKPVPFKGDESAVKRDEADRIMAKIGDGDRLIALDERGKALDSHQFAQMIDEAAQQGTRRIVFAIGGPYGHGTAVRDKAWRTVRLSTMVLNHSLARVVLSEQLYRASTLLWGGSYHH
jgi:23S rRNA (pseudouridine1915-N3)-methyltransferase